MDHYDENFSNTLFQTEQLQNGAYDGCTFQSCSFADKQFNHLEFLGCKFIDCDFSQTKSVQTAFKDALFINCKLIGFDFSVCVDFLFQVKFESSLLDYALFGQKNMKQTRFKACSVKEADFSGTNLSGAVFEQCDLTNTLFDNCNLEKADFRSARHFTIDPNRNRMKGARFSNFALAGLLRNYRLKID
ncbi:pentapeptide repeat-containing protein [Mangrovibacterium lignilyticum]|uniref:pentapeptide repeat-containing protein n=1 Tax=Mangrovibacterium lignilyticum TaxID=2668052 RepID=UPI0013D054F4|nr:pentapeptide repeat-containing protein [Mangrovibacterium lignilyticum]